MHAPPAGRVDIWWKSLEAVATPGSRDALNAILRYYGRAPWIETSAEGKPSLVGADDFSFNLSHSETWLVVAVGDGAPVGVDCEAVRPFPELMDVARMTLSKPELDLLSSANGDSTVGLFHDLWTRKEALVKAIGVGVSFPLSELNVPPRAGAPVSRVDVPGHGQWWLRSIEAPDGFAAACACRRPFDVLSRA
jgi:4'-phosphopantetheinyl transferase